MSQDIGVSRTYGNVGPAVCHFGVSLAGTLSVARMLGRSRGTTLVPVDRVGMREFLESLQPASAGSGPRPIEELMCLHGLEA